MAIASKFGRETVTKQGFQLLQNTRERCAPWVGHNAYIDHRGRNGHSSFLKCGTLKMSTDYI